MLWWTLRKLKSADASSRHAAVDALANRRPPEPEALAALTGLLADPSPEIADHAERALGSMGEPAAEPLCAVLASAHSPDVRRRAVSALGAVGGGRAVQSLEAVAANTSDDIRNHAVLTLAGVLLRQLPLHAVETPKETQRLVQLIGEISDQAFLAEIVLGERRGLVPHVPLECLLAATGRIDNPTVLARVAEKYRPSRSAGETYSPVHALARQRIQAIEREQTLSRGLAASGGSAQDDGSLARALRHADIKVREAAAAELKLRKWTPRTKEERAWFYAGLRAWSSVADLGAEGVPALASAIESGADRLPDAIRALGQTRDARALVVLARCTTSGDWEIRAAAAQALGSLRDAGALALLIPLLRDPYFKLPSTKPWTPAASIGSPSPEKNYWSDEAASAHPVRKAALEALVRLRAPGVVSALVDLAGDAQASASEQAVQALRTIMREDGRSLPAEELERLAALPRVYRTEMRETGYRDPEGGESGRQAIDVEIDCDDLRTSARAEIQRRGADV